MATQLLSVTEVAAILSCSRGHVYDLITAGHFAPIDIGARSKSKTRVDSAELEAFINRRTQQCRQ